MKPETDALNLKRLLLAEYGSFADKRIKKVEKGRLFIVDDRAEGGVASDGAPYGWFCQMVLDVIDGDTVLVKLINLPVGPTVTRWAAVNRIRLRADESLELSITSATATQLITLAEALRAIVARGAPRYSVASYKYACPRTADSLDRLASALTRAWG
jgi:hypothetical protein